MEQQQVGTPQPLMQPGMKFSSTLRIFVIKLGWVIMGTITHADEHEIFLTNASVVRVWGTTAGLGELAIKGPLKETVLDACGDAILSKHSILWQCPCVEDSWKLS